MSAKKNGEWWTAWRTSGVEVRKPDLATFAGEWSNSRGSVLKLSVKKGGQISGTFSTGIGEVEPGRPFKIVGVANGDLLSFIVNWETKGSITAWVGRKTTDSDGNDSIVTMWHLARNAHNAEGGTPSSWDAFLAGSDVFRRVEKPNRKKR